MAITGQVPTALPICFFESQAAIGTKGRTEITIAGEIVTLPSVTEPDAAQSVILNRLGLNLPRFTPKSHLSPYLIVPTA